MERSVAMTMPGRNGGSKRVRAAVIPMSLGMLASSGMTEAGTPEMFSVEGSAVRCTAGETCFMYFGTGAVSITVSASGCVDRCVGSGGTAWILLQTWHCDPNYFTLGCLSTGGYRAEVALDCLLFSPEVDGGADDVGGGSKQPRSLVHHRPRNDTGPRIRARGRGSRFSALSSARERRRFRRGLRVRATRLRGEHARAPCRSSFAARSSIRRSASAGCAREPFPTKRDRGSRGHAERAVRWLGRRSKRVR